jgi:hypothetical protein
MRRWVPAVAAVILVTSCSQTVAGKGQPSKLTPIPSSSRSSAAPVVPAAVPAPGTPIATVVAWVEAGQPADDTDFHIATRDGVSTDLGPDVAFTSPSGDASCVTNKLNDGALACTAKLTDPPPRPPDPPYNWVGGWVDYDGQMVMVGSMHGDPGPLVYGDGPVLPSGQSLKFGDFQCRSDPVGIFCVNLAHESGVRIGADGIIPFGCLAKVTPPENVGLQFSC